MVTVCPGAALEGTTLSILSFCACSVPGITVRVRGCHAKIHIPSRDGMTAPFAVISKDSSPLSKRYAREESQ